MKLLRKILFPIVPIYFIVTWLRNKLYDYGLKKSTSYDFPVICVGNLSVGGTGKTPMIEYLIRILANSKKVATLSRGYGRRTTGFILADETDNAITIGDEPYQFYRKFEDILVAVDANRRRGIKELKSSTATEVVLLDDAFQHRKITSGLSILLTSFENLYSSDMVLPTGDLREPRSGAKRADIIVVTKCPESLSESAKIATAKKLSLDLNQTLFFSWITYDQYVYGQTEREQLKSFKNQSVTVITGIAKPELFLRYLNSKIVKYKHVKFNDHHNFSKSEIDNLKQSETIITTEKDYVRLARHFLDSTTSLYYLPIEFKIDKEQEFANLILNYVKSS